MYIYSSIYIPHVEAQQPRIDPSLVNTKPILRCRFVHHNIASGQRLGFIHIFTIPRASPVASPTLFVLEHTGALPGSSV